MKNYSLLLLLFFVFFLTGCNQEIKNEETKQIILSEIQEKNADIKTQKVSIQEINCQIIVPAQFKARNQAQERIYAPVDGKITEIYFEPGAYIKKGQSIARIKSDEISQIQLEFLDKLLEVNSNINELKAQYELSYQNFKREETLFKEKISSKAEYETARAVYRQDSAKLEALNSRKNALINVYRQRLSVYGAGIDSVLQTKHISPYITIRASRSGVLLSRKVNSGEFVEKNTEMFSMADLDTIWLVGYAFEKDAKYLHYGESITGTVEGQNKSVTGVLTYVSPILDDTTKTLEVRADIPNKEHKIKPNMYAEMFVDIENIKDLAVPNSAVEKYGDYYFVFVKTAPYTYEERKVEIGKKDNNFVQILSGLKEGEEVAVSGAFELLGESIK